MPPDLELKDFRGRMVTAGLFAKWPQGSDPNVVLSVSLRSQCGCSGMCALAVPSHGSLGTLWWQQKSWAMHSHGGHISMFLVPQHAAWYWTHARGEEASSKWTRTTAACSSDVMAENFGSVLGIPDVLGCNGWSEALLNFALQGLGFNCLMYRGRQRQVADTSLEIRISMMVFLKNLSYCYWVTWWDGIA